MFKKENPTFAQKQYMKKQIQHVLLVLIIIFVNIGCDQHTKQLAQEKLSHQPTFINSDHVFTFIYAENRGAFLSWGADLPDSVHFLLLKIAPTILLLGMMLYVLFGRAVGMVQAIGLSFVLGGGLSNLYDRLLYGRVVDFMNMGIGELRTGIFNVADIAIVIGIGIFLWGSSKSTIHRG